MFYMEDVVLCSYMFSVEEVVLCSYMFSVEEVVLCSYMFSVEEVVLCSYMFSVEEVVLCSYMFSVEEVVLCSYMFSVEEVVLCSYMLNVEEVVLCSYLFSVEEVVLCSYMFSVEEVVLCSYMFSVEEVVLCSYMFSVEEVVLCSYMFSVEEVVLCSYMLNVEEVVLCSYMFSVEEVVLCSYMFSVEEVVLCSYMFSVEEVVLCSYMFSVEEVVLCSYMFSVEEVVLCSYMFSVEEVVLCSYIISVEEVVPCSYMFSVEEVVLCSYIISVEEVVPCSYMFSVEEVVLFCSYFSVLYSYHSYISVVSANTLKATWDPIVTKSGFQVRYQLFDGTKCVYTGKQCECEVIGLQPNTPYIYKLRAYTEGDESPFSDIVSIITEEAVPGPPQSVRVLGATITQLKIGWDPPAESNGVLKGYYVFIDDKEVMHTIENSVILTGLTANTTYDVEVCAATAKGRGERNGTTGTTSEIGAHAPSKPHINVIGRNELYISWAAPEVPLGRLNRYDVIMNDKVIYSGSDLNLPVRRLVPDTEYSFVVVALTSEGKFESKMAKKRTAKDEYDQARPPLYQAPKKEPTEEGSKTPVGQPTVKRRKSSARVSSAKAVPKRVGTGKERTKSSGSINKDERPVSGTSSTSHHDVVEDKIEKIDKIEKQPDPLTAVSLSSSSNNSPAPSSTPSPLVGKPVAEVKFEAPAPRIPSSKTRMPRTLNKIERNTVTSRPQPVAISTVSMQNSSKTEHYGKNSEINETDKKVIENGKKKPEKDLPVLSNSLKVERSRTTFSGRENRRGKFTSSPSNSYVSNTSQNVKPDNDLEKGETLNKISPEKIRPITNDRESGSVNVSRRSRVSEENILMSSREKDKGITKEPRERSSRGQSSRTKAVKDANLPKPAPPSQKYLEGTAQVDVPWGHRTIPSPRSSKDAAFMDSDWLTQVKSVSENYTRPFANSNVLSNSADSTYFIDPSQFLQRTNTYISSHSHGGSLKRCNSSKERVSSSKITLQHFKFTSQIKLISRDHDTESGDVERPIGRKSLERLQKSNQGMKAPMPTKLGQSVNNFDFDIPENTSSKLANKFIPMQLRTQPSNLGMGQLQRVNTTLMGELTGDNSVSFRRVEAMTRSHTQMDMKQQNQFALKQPTTFDLKQHAQQQIPMENRRDLGFLTNKDKDRAMKKASSTGKVHKLGGSALTSHQRNKEPDSMYLQQSWGLNSTTDLGALQNVR
ncbi:hypothetical protein ACF0H5_021829 [Mactra antiquata]